jgi:catechol 2,3-dioxygenase-like lactoylglutathione lyase family enzyme
MIDHIGLRARDAAEVRLLKTFYAAALEPLGYQVLREFGAEHNIGYIGVGLGVDGKPDFWIGTATGEPTEPSGRMHLAFVAGDRAAVDAFHRAAIAAGARDNGPPGPRPHYHVNYYGAFVVDPAGNNLEAVCHRPA